MNNQKPNALELSAQVNALVALQKGTIHTFVYRKQVVMSAKFGDVVIETETVMQGRVGCEYENIQAVKDLHANGMGHAPLKGFTEVIEDIIYRNDKTGELALRVFPVNNGYHSKRYFENGVEVSLDYLLSKGYPKSKLVSNGFSPIVCLYVKNIVSVA